MSATMDPRLRGDDGCYGDCGVSLTGWRRLPQQFPILRVLLDIGRDERALRDDLQPPVARRVECGADQFRADAAAFQCLGHDGVGEDDRAAFHLIGRDGIASIIIRLM